MYAGEYVYACVRAFVECASSGWNVYIETHVCIAARSARVPRCISRTKAPLHRHVVCVAALYTRVYECVYTYMHGSACATTRNTLRTRTSKQTQSNQFARLIDFPSHGRCRARASCAARLGPNIERQCNAPYKSNPKLSFDYQANSRGRL